MVILTFSKIQFWRKLDDESDTSICSHAWCMEGEVWDLGLKDLQEHNQY